MSEALKVRQYKCIAFLAMLYVTLGICCPTLLGNKLVQFPFGVLSATSIVGPFWFILADIIAEIYGFQMAKRLFILESIIEILFIAICDFFVNFKPLEFGQSYYDHFFQYALSQNLISLLVLIIAWYINVSLLIKWKTLTNGKYFWLRSVGSSSICLVLFSFIMFPTWFLFGPVSTLKDAFELGMWGCALKIISVGILAIPISFVVNILKIIEHPEPHVEDFPPFNKAEWQHK